MRVHVRAVGAQGIEVTAEQVAALPSRSESPCATLRTWSTTGTRRLGYRDADMLAGMHPADRHYENETIRLASLAVTEDIIRSVTFSNCQLIGPAIVIPMGETVITDCTFEGDFEAFIWPFDDDRSWFVGPIGLDSCRLYSCRFTRIGLAAPASKIEDIRQGFAPRP
jgi:hypothetical protein